MPMRSLVPVLAALVWTLAGVAAVQAQDTSAPPPGAQASCDTQDACPDPLPVAEATPAVEVAGVQTAPDDARQPGEADPFIINDGFGD
jgi:hypothetical protein